MDTLLTLLHPNILPLLHVYNLLILLRLISIPHAWNSYKNVLSTPTPASDIPDCTDPLMRSLPIPTPGAWQLALNDTSYSLLLVNYCWHPALRHLHAWTLLPQPTWTLIYSHKTAILWHCPTPLLLAGSLRVHAGIHLTQVHALLIFLPCSNLNTPHWDQQNLPDCRPLFSQIPYSTCLDSSTLQLQVLLCRCTPCPDNSTNTLIPSGWYPTSSRVHGSASHTPLVDTYPCLVPLDSFDIIIQKGKRKRTKNNKWWYFQKVVSVNKLCKHI